MTIKRNGMEIELTTEELRKAYDEYELICRIEDIMSAITQADFDEYFSDDDLENEKIMHNIANNISDILGDCDMYWDIYWQVVADVVEEYIKEHPKQM